MKKSRIPSFTLTALLIKLLVWLLRTRDYLHTMGKRSLGVLERWRQRIKVRHFHRYVFLAVMICTGIILLLPDTFLFTLINSLALQITAAFVVIALWWLKTRRWKYAASTLVCALGIGFTLPPFWNGAEVLPGPSDLSVAHFNVLISNRQYDKMVTKARNTGADFMSFQEVNAEWAEALENGLKSTYPYYVLLPSDSYFGMAVFSRFPLHNVETFTTRQVPNLVGDIEVGDSTIHFLAAHTYSPTKPWKYRQRNRHIEALADYLDAIQGPKIAVGDFNSVPWDHALEDFRHQTALQDSRTSWSATYPSWLSIAGIPIDYIFFSRELDCLEFRVVHDTNSDHHGIVSRFRLPAEASG